METDLYSDFRVATTWPQCRRPAMHILRSTHAGLTLYVSAGASALPDSPYRCTYALVHETEGPDGEPVHHLIAETDSAESVQAIVELIEIYVQRLRYSVAKLLSGYTDIPLSSLADYGGIHSQASQQALLAELQALTSHTLPASASTGFVQAVRSTVDAWVMTRRRIRCDWVQTRSGPEYGRKHPAP